MVVRWEEELLVEGLVFGVKCRKKVFKEEKDKEMKRERQRGRDRRLKKK